MSINLDIPVADFLDKLTILEIKRTRISDTRKLDNISREYGIMMSRWEQSRYSGIDISDQLDSLRRVNEALWEIEDAIRAKEARDEFDKEFIELARSVYLTNDKRATIKRELNLLLGSDLVEEKSYTDYKK